MTRRLNEDYNGWRNWGTWYASIILGEDDYIKELANDNNYDTYEFSNALKSYFYEIVLGDVPEDSLAYKYAEYGLEDVDFYELAETFLLDIEPNDEDEEY